MSVAPADTSSPSWFEAMRAPRAVAVIGASDDPRKISGRVVDYLKRFGYPGTIVPVNARRSTVQGLPSYPDLGSVPDAVDLAVVCVPAAGVLEALRECEAAGVSLAVVFSSGFGETGGDGPARQAELEAFLSRSSLRVLGPNSLGLLSADESVVATFTSAMDSMRPRSGNIAIISQSGAFGSFILSSADALGLGVRHFVSTGNEADLDVPEALAEVVVDPEIDVALVYTEGIRNGSTFRAAARSAVAHGTRVLAVKVGRSAEGARAAALHTGALVGEDRVYDCVLAENGVARVETIEELLDAAQVLSAYRGGAGPRLSIVTISGGGGIMMVDAATAHGLSIASWAGEWKERLTDLIPVYGSAANPIDVTAELIYRPELLEGVLDLCLEHPETDQVAVLVGNVASREDELVSVLEKVHRAGAKPLAVAWVGGSGQAVGKLRACGIPAYTDPVRTVRALAALPTPPMADVAGLEAAGERADRARSILDEAGRGGATILDEVAAKRLFDLYDVPVPREREVAGPAEAVAALDEVGLPVAVKLVSAHVTHKEKVGGVRLGLADADAVAAAATEVLAAARAAGADDARLVVQEMAEPGLELFVGARVDPTFGPLVVVGAGGTSVEVLADSAMASAPLTPERAGELIRSLRHGVLLDDWRGRGPRDVAAMAATVVAVSRLVADLADRIHQIDINPVIVGSAGAGVRAVDGLVLLATALHGTDDEEAQA